MLNFPMFIPIIIYIVAGITESIIKKHSGFGIKKKVEVDNLFVYRYGASAIIATGVLYEMIGNGYSLFVPIYIAMFIIATASTLRSYYKKYHGKHVYTIRMSERKISTIELLRNMSKKSNQFFITYPGYGNPQLIIKEQYYKNEESIVEKIANLDIF